MLIIYIPYQELKIKEWWRKTYKQKVSLNVLNDQEKQDFWTFLSNLLLDKILVEAF